MIFETEEQYQSKIIEPSKQSDTIVIDNGSFEMKAGFLGDLSIISKNYIFKSKGKTNLKSFPSSQKITMFDRDVIFNPEIFGTVFDTILCHLKPKILNKLILTVTPFSPTNEALVEYLFSTYKINTIQLGYDFIFHYHKYFGNEDCFIIDISHKGVFICYIKNNSIDYCVKLNFGGIDLLKHIKEYMHSRYKNYKLEYDNLINYLRVSQNYKEESVTIFNEMCSGIYENVKFFTESPKSPELETAKRLKKTESKNLEIPEINYQLLETADEYLEHEDVRAKRRQKLLFYSTLARLKLKMEKHIGQIGSIVENVKDELEKKENLSNYIKKKKQKFENLKKMLKKRDILRKFAKNKKTREFQIKFKVENLTAEETELQEQILEAEDMELEEQLINRVNNEGRYIKELDPDFIPFYANTVEILRGDNLEQECVNIELIKWPEIFFNPSILNINDVGISEGIEEVCLKYDVKNVLVTGGLSKIPGMSMRIKNEIIRRSKSSEINFISIEDPKTDPFMSACDSPLCLELKKEDWEEKRDEINNF